MKIIGLPALVGSYDNYIWVLYEADSAWVIDPGVAAPVLTFLKEHGLQLQGILITHYHPDHTGGLTELKQAFPALTIYGPEKTPNPLIDIRLKEGDKITLTKGYDLNVLDTPGHTYDHISFYNNEVVFCGDTLFAGGCGRHFDGGFDQFAQSILKLRNLPDHLKFYSAHEYTETNLEFAHYIDSDNRALNERIQQTDIDYPSDLTIPQSSLALEKATNPFLRFDHPNIQQKLQKRGATTTPESLFKTLRQWKDEIDKNGFPKRKQNISTTGGH